MCENTLTVSKEGYFLLHSIFLCHWQQFDCLQFWASQIVYVGNKTYSLVLNKSPPPRLLIFGNFSHPPDLIWTPPLINFGKFLVQQLQNIQSILPIKGILTNFSVPELYWRRKRMDKLRYRHREHNLIPYI